MPRQSMDGLASPTLRPTLRMRALSMDARVKPAYDDTGIAMPKAKRTKKREKVSKRAPAMRVFSAAPADDERVLVSDLTLHDLFAQQTTAMLDRADLSDEQKQSLLIGMSCPCCGAGGFSFTAKLKR